MKRTQLTRTLMGIGLTLILSSVGLVPAQAASAPVITWGDSAIADGSSYVFGAVPAAPTCTATEDLAPVTCAVEGYSTLVGIHVLTATAVASDTVTTTVETRSYTVTGWTFKGFAKPVKANVVNKVKAGSTVPLKFRVFVGGNEATSIGVVSSITAQKYDCVTGAPLADPVSVTKATQKSLRLRYYDRGFHQNWKTPKLPKKVAMTKVKGKKPAPAPVCYMVVVTTQDASTLSAKFQLR